MNKLQNYIAGKWITGDGEGQLLFNAVTGEPIAAASTKGLDFAAMVEYGKKIGNPALRKMTFHERGRMLRALATHLLERKEKFYQLSYRTGATKADSWIDIEGVLEIYSAMLHCAENFLIYLIAPMENLLY